MAKTINETQVTDALIRAGLLDPNVTRDTARILIDVLPGHPVRIIKVEYADRDALVRALSELQGE